MNHRCCPLSLIQVRRTALALAQPDFLLLALEQERTAAHWLPPRQAQLSFHLLPSLLTVTPLVLLAREAPPGAQLLRVLGLTQVLPFHRRLEQHSGPQGEIGGNYCGYVNLFFIPISHQIHNEHPLSWFDRRMSARFRRCVPPQKASTPTQSRQ